MVLSLSAGSMLFARQAGDSGGSGSSRGRMMLVSMVTRPTQDEKMVGGVMIFIYVVVVTLI